MIKRIAFWTLLGVIVAAGWALISFIHGVSFNTLFPIIATTMPLAIVGRRLHLPITYQETILLNAITYAFIGLAVEFLRQGFRSFRLRLHSR